MKRGQTYLIENTDPAMIGSLFIYYLKNLKASLIDYEYISSHCNINFQTVKEILSYSSPRAISYLRRLIPLLTDILSHSFENDYTMNSIIRIFCPLLCKPRNKRISNNISFNDLEKLFTLLFQHQKEYFSENTIINQNKLDNMIKFSINHIMNDNDKYILPPSYTLLHFQDKERKQSKLKDYTDLQSYLHHRIVDYENLYQNVYGVKPSVLLLLLFY